MNYGFVVPVYNHGSTLEFVVKQLSEYGFPIIVVDDGNNEVNKKFISEVEQKYSKVVVVTHKKNGGKGKAMNDGVRKAYEMGISHILQIDSDGQHDAGRIGHFLEVSKSNPEAVICGYPEYDENAPSKRVNGRKVANAWIHLVTLSNEIKDSMIGFRVYPVEPYYKLISGFAFIDGRMGYDIDILVRFSWKGIKIISESVKISYPIDGVSNFRMVRDNIRISLTYAKLVIGMIVRLPILIFRKIGKK